MFFCQVMTYRLAHTTIPVIIINFLHTYVVHSGICLEASIGTPDLKDNIGTFLDLQYGCHLYRHHEAKVFPAKTIFARVKIYSNLRVHHCSRLGLIIRGENVWSQRER